MTHRAWSFLVRQRTMAANAFVRISPSSGLSPTPASPTWRSCPRKHSPTLTAFQLMRAALAILVRQIVALNEEVGALDRELFAWHAQNEASHRLAGSPASA